MVEKTKVSFYNMVPIIQKFENRVFLEKKALSKPLKRSIFKEQKRFKSQSSIQCIWGTFWVST